MNFDVYFPFKNREGKLCPGVKAYTKGWRDILGISNMPVVTENVESYRNGDAEAKKNIPAICFTGHSKSGKRLASEMEPTQFVMIDIDHCDDPRSSFNSFFEQYEKVRGEGDDVLALAHITPSGKGLRLVFLAISDEPTLLKHMTDINEKYSLSTYGDFDSACKDLGRLSFCFKRDELLYCNDDVMNMEKVANTPIKNAYANSSSSQSPAAIFSGDNSLPVFTVDETQKFDSFLYRGIAISEIVKKYVEVYGEPGSGERHNYYNEMVKNFRCICDNNKRLLLYILPDFGHTYEERWSQIVSICRVNTLSRIPKPFYFFLKDNGFYQPRTQAPNDLMAFMLDETEKKNELPPYLPPVFRELVGSAPTDFVVPCVNSLLPILGTLTSYLTSKYPYDGREHTTSFFSIVYAPPGTGKGFVERFMSLLFEDLRLRDYVQSERENVYLRAVIKKGANEKSPDQPHVSLRIIPPKNSEAEFLQKQRDNQGYHMFTYAAEMDSWAKGVRAAGGNKDDMIRIAWDNGEYGQQFKSANTFKGMVNLYWNVLITGTIAQVESYFKNVENGLVTRCSFCEIKNQEFSLPPSWKNINKRGMEVIRAFMKRCDERTYESPCNIVPDDLLGITDEDFDKEVDWRFKFKPKREVDMSWVMPVIDAFHQEQMKLAARDVDRARDVFRRRVGVRGFRLGLICYGLWESPRLSDLQKCLPFINWWMHRDIENLLELWGDKYNKLTDVSPHVVQRTVFDALPATFTRADVYSVCVQQGIKTPVRRIVYDWKKLNYVTQLDKEHFKKK